MADLIDRRAAIDALRYAQHRFTVADEAGGLGTVKWSEDVIYFAAAERVLTELPSAQPEIKCVANVTLTDEQVKEAFEKAKCEILVAQPDLDTSLYTDGFTDGYKQAQMDAQEIIRCKECKHLYEDSWCPLRTWRTHTEDDFCSYAERRTDETD